MGSGIRFVALGAVFRGDELLVFEAESPSTGEVFYRLLGGGVEFVDPTPVGTFERTFSYDDESEHEVWRVYEGGFRESWPYREDRFSFTEPELGTEHLARWMSRERLRAESTTFYSPAVLDALDA